MIFAKRRVTAINRDRIFLWVFIHPTDSGDSIMSAPVTSSCISHEIIIGILSIHTLLHLKRFNTNDRTSQEICDTITLGVLGLSHHRQSSNSVFPTPVLPAGKSQTYGSLLRFTNHLHVNPLKDEILFL